MEVHNKFGSMSEFRSKYPGSFFINALIPCPTDKIQELPGTMTVVSLGVEGFRNFQFQFVIDSDWQGWGLNAIRNLIQSCWFQHANMEKQVYSVETVQKS